MNEKTGSSAASNFAGSHHAILVGSKTRTRRSLKQFGSRLTAAGIAGSVLVGLLPTSAMAAPPPGAVELEGKVDTVIGNFMTQGGVPGVNVAVSKDGRLILSKGYGFAKSDNGQTFPMRADTRMRIGSSTKAAITGPSAVELLAKHGVSSDTPLYGPNGFYKGIFDADIADIISKLESDSITDVTSQHAPYEEWYAKVTIQHLLDHTAGFARSGDIKGAAAMFGVPEDQVTYEQIHRHFLRTKPLLFEPGTDEKYSNHGFGSLTLVIEQLSGKSYPEYTRDDYLKPMNLHNGVRGEWANPDSCDSYNHDFSSPVDEDPNTPPPPPKIFPFERYDQGLASGGFRSSAQDLVRIMHNLDQRYDIEQIDRMGWSATPEGRLAKDGDIGGGNSYMTMYKEGYEIAGLSNVHVVVVANINVDTRSTALSVANQVANTDVEATYDMWPQVLAAKHCEYSRHGVPAAEFQAIFSEAIRHGYRLEWVDGYTVGGKVFFNSIFRAKGPAVGWAAKVELSGESYQNNFDSYKAEGYSLAHVDSYAVGNTVRYAAIWTKGASDLVAYHGKPVGQHQQQFNQLTGDGWTPKVLSVAVANGVPYFTALYTKQPAGTVYAKAGMTSAQYQNTFSQKKTAGLKLRYLNAYIEGGQVRFSGIWTSLPQVPALTANHGLSFDGLSKTWEQNLSAGYETKVVTGYEDGGVAKFAALWTK
jgi:CubicO group peptidase (beta-lactamase class C family)